MTNVDPPCPGCGNPLSRVTQPSNSPLNHDQWESTIAGNWFCPQCPGSVGGAREGKTGYAYWWDNQIEDLYPLCYIQDASTVVGDDALWWKPEGWGYTTDLGKAGVWRRDQLPAGLRDTDVPRRKKEVDALAYRVADAGKVSALVAVEGRRP